MATREDVPRQNDLLSPSRNSRIISSWGSARQKMQRKAFMYLLFSVANSNVLCEDDGHMIEHVLFSMNCSTA
jgi:hypothetical protein